MDALIETMNHDYIQRHIACYARLWKHQQLFASTLMSIIIPIVLFFSSFTGMQSLALSPFKVAYQDPGS